MIKSVRNIDKWLKDYIIEKQLVHPDVLNTFENERKKQNVPFHDIIIQHGVLSASQIIELIKPVSVHDVVNLEEIMIPTEIFDSLPKDIITKYHCIPIELDKQSRKITIAMSDPSNLMALDSIRQVTKLNAKITFALYAQIQNVIEGYEKNSNINDIIEEMRGTTVDVEKEEDPDLSNFEGANTDEPLIVRMVNSILSDAVNVGASDVHIEPLEHNLRIRFRIDGLLVERFKNLEKQFIAPISSRIKVLSNLDISETRRPQDGRFRVRIANNIIDVRVSTMSSQFGEKIVLRLTSRNLSLTSIENMGFSEQETATLRKVTKRPYGLILVTGPTGSGKTTTLYGMLNFLNEPSKNIVTIEDPIERQIPGVIHTPVNPKADITFSSGLKTILRQDPDIVMVGEVRDFETAETTISAALTGHLVLTTLHTNDSAGSVTRLSDMNVEPFKIASSVVAVIAQRLVRVNCPHCSKEHIATPEERAICKSISPNMELPDQLIFHKGEGCKKCSNIGYKGRQGVFEILIMSEQLKQLILSGASTKKIQEVAIQEGMKTMAVRGLELVLEGKTTLEELQRVVFVE